MKCGPKFLCFSARKTGIIIIILTASSKLMLYLSKSCDPALLPLAVYNIHKDKKISSLHFRQSIPPTLSFTQFNCQLLSDCCLNP